MEKKTISKEILEREREREREREEEEEEEEEEEFLGNLCLNFLEEGGRYL